MIFYEKNNCIVVKKKSYGFSKFLWFICIGLWACIKKILLGCILCCLIVTIPFGLVYFKSLKLVAFPQDKVVVTHFEHHPVKNPLWLIFGFGLTNWILNKIVAFIMYIGVITIPFGKQFSKFANYYISPFGAEIITYGTLSNEIHTQYEADLVVNRIVYEAIKDRKKITDFIHEHKKIILTNRGKSFGEYKTFYNRISFYSLNLFRDYFDIQGRDYSRNLKIKAFGANRFYIDKNTYFKQNKIDYKKNGLVKVYKNGEVIDFSLNKLFVEGLSDNYEVNTSSID